MENTTEEVRERKRQRKYKLIGEDWGESEGGSGSNLNCLEGTPRTSLVGGWPKLPQGGPQECNREVQKFAQKFAQIKPSEKPKLARKTDNKGSKLAQNAKKVQKNDIKAYFKPRENVVMCEESGMKLKLRCNLEKNSGGVTPPLKPSSSEICAEQKCKPNISTNED